VEIATSEVLLVLASVSLPPRCVGMVLRGLGVISAVDCCGLVCGVAVVTTTLVMAGSWITVALGTDVDAAADAPGTAGAVPAPVAGTVLLDETAIVAYGAVDAGTIVAVGAAVAVSTEVGVSRLVVVGTVVVGTVVVGKKQPSCL